MEAERLSLEAGPWEVGSLQECRISLASSVEKKLGSI
jgi:hypothetical protein